MKIGFSCWLNLLWLICSLPVVTCGAATAALYSVTLKMCDDTDYRITSQFFKAFRENFAQATRLWLIMLGLGIILGLDGWAVAHLRASSAGFIAVMWTLNLALLIAAAVIYAIVLIWVFPMTAKFRNSDFAMLKNSFLIGVRYLFCTIMVFLMHFVMFYAVVAVFTPLIILGEGICALLSSLLMVNVFRVIAYEQTEGEDQ